MSVTIRYFAGARAAAGLDSESVEAGTVAELVSCVGDRHGPAMTKVLGVCSFLVNGTVSSDPEVALPPGSAVDVLPPFAGG